MKAALEELQTGEAISMHHVDRVLLNGVEGGY